jgi:hypothetical protein
MALLKALFCEHGLSTGRKTMTYDQRGDDECAEFCTNMKTVFSLALACPNSDLTTLRPKIRSTCNPYKSACLCTCTRPFWIQAPEVQKHLKHAGKRVREKRQKMSCTVLLLFVEFVPRFDLKGSIWLATPSKSATSLRIWSTQGRKAARPWEKKCLTLNFFKESTKGDEPDYPTDSSTLAWWQDVPSFRLSAQRACVLWERKGTNRLSQEFIHVERVY